MRGSWVKNKRNNDSNRVFFCNVPLTFHKTYARRGKKMRMEKCECVASPNIKNKIGSFPTSSCNTLYDKYPIHRESMGMTVGFQN
jgi:hypothetical protein